MANYLKNFVTGHNIKFESNKHNLAAFEKANQLWGDINSIHKPNGESTILIAGGRNNGKSSLLRYLVNTYNDTHSSRTSSTTSNDAEDNTDACKSDSSSIAPIDGNDVADNGCVARDADVYAYLIDYDPGQSEMTSPGIISAHIIRATAPPLQRPPYLNIAQHESITMSSVGGVNMSVNPRMYIANVRYVYNKVIEHRNSQTVKRPIFVNTMGHIRNVGLAMLMDLIKICQPTNLIVLNSGSDPMRKVYADLSPRALDNTRASFYYDTSQQRQKKLDYKYDTRDLDFTFVDSSSVSTRNRVAAQLAYMATIPEAIYKPIMQLSTRWLSFKKVSVYCVSSYPLKEVIVLELLQHSWIHLARLKQSSMEAPVSAVDSITRQTSNASQPGENSICKILEDISENTVYGCGIVADIDLDQRLVAVITPVDQETLDEYVDCIIKPLSIQVPPQMMQEGL